MDPLSVLRTGVLDDAEVLAAIHRRARQEAMPWLPTMHTPEEDRAFFSDVVLARQRVWVAERGGVAIGLAAVDGEWLEHLYVEPSAQGSGVGRTLLEAAQEHGARRLHVFARNTSARRFYEAAGWRCLAADCDNEEGLPACTYGR